MFTEKGEQAFELSTKGESLRKIMGHLSKRERRQLRLILQKLLDKALDEVGKQMARHQ